MQVFLLMANHVLAQEIYKNHMIHYTILLFDLEKTILLKKFKLHFLFFIESV